MTDYINNWLKSHDPEFQTKSISARVNNETFVQLEELMAMFNISKTEAIQGALDTGLKELLPEAHKVFNADGGE